MLTRAAPNFRQGIAARPEDMLLQRNLTVAMERLGKVERQPVALAADSLGSKSSASNIGVDDAYWVK